MVAGKPATNSLLLTNQQTGTLLPGGSVDVSFAFHATSVGRWSHDLAVRNLSNKHDQASEQGRIAKQGVLLWVLVLFSFFLSRHNLFLDGMCALSLAVYWAFFCSHLKTLQPKGVVHPRNRGCRLL